MKNVRGDNMKKINFPLLIGLLLLTILLAFTLAPNHFTNKDPYNQEHFTFGKVVEDGQKAHQVTSPPWGPKKENIMGTDELGRDIYSRLVYGTKSTLQTALLVVLLRFLLAVPFGIIAGIGSKTASSIIRFFNIIFTAIPTLFAAFFVLNIKYVASLKVEDSIIAFGVVLTVVGWAKLAKQVEEKASNIMKEEFIEGEVAVGKSKVQIVFQNMIPHLVPSLISFIFIEVGLVIFLLAQLSILETFIGPRSLFKRDGGSSGWMVADNPEWASMLSRTVINNRVGKYWISLFPALAFTIGILAFNLTGEGLRMEFEKRTSPVASIIRRSGFAFSPRIYFQQVTRFREYYKPVLIKTLCIVLIITYGLIPPPKSLYQFESHQAMIHLEELIKPQYQGRLSGYEGNYLAGDYIIEKLKEYGLEPYDGENYAQTFPLNRVGNWTAIVEEATITLTSNNGEISSYQLHNDFDLASIKAFNVDDEDLYFNNNYISFIGFSSTNEELRNNKQLMLVDFVDSYYDLAFKVSRGITKTPVSFSILEDNSKEIIPTYIAENYTIIPKGELAEKLKTAEYKVEVKIKQPNIVEEGRNIIAVLPGKSWFEPNDSNNKKEVIIVGASYDGIGMVDNKTSAMRTSNAAINLEIARVLSQIKEPLDKTIIFAFWDGDSVGSSGSYYYNIYQRLFSQQNYVIYYFDVGYANNEKRISIDFKSPVNSEVGTYDIFNDISKLVKKKKIAHVFKQSNSKTFYNIGDNMSLKVSVNAANDSNLDTVQDKIENINTKQMESIGQIFIDLITMDKNFK